MTNPFETSDNRNVLTCSLPVTPMTKHEALWFLQRAGNLSTISDVNPRTLHSAEDRLDYCLRLGVIVELPDGKFIKRIVVREPTVLLCDEWGNEVDCPQSQAAAEIARVKAYLRDNPRDAKSREVAELRRRLEAIEAAAS